METSTKLGEGATSSSDYRRERGARYLERFSSDPGSDIGGRLFAAKMRRYIPPHARVFEFGCGTGRNLLAVQREIKAGYDINEHARAIARGCGLTVYDVPELISRWVAIVPYHALALTTLTKVFARILKSRPKDQLSMYSQSSFTTSSKSLTEPLPLSCHNPVMPGFMARRRK